MENKMTDDCGNPFKYDLNIKKGQQKLVNEHIRMIVLKRKIRQIVWSASILSCTKRRSPAIHTHTHTHTHTLHPSCISVAVFPESRAAAKVQQQRRMQTQTP